MAWQIGADNRYLQRPFRILFYRDRNGHTCRFESGSVYFFQLDGACDGFVSFFYLGIDCFYLFQSIQNDITGVNADVMGSNGYVA